MMIEYTRFDGQAWVEFGKNLLAQDGSDEQVEFLQACLDGRSAFVEYIDTHLPNSSIINGKPINFNHKFSEKEFINPPPSTQEIIWNEFNGYSDETMYCCGFWGYVIKSMIDNDLIQSSYLASKLNGVKDTGAYVIDEALKSNDVKKQDSCVRRILRSMCNSEPRGKRLVFDDFYLGRAYWRWRWASKMTHHIGLNFDQILVSLSEGNYAAFAGKMHSGESYIGSENLLGGLLLHLNITKSISGKDLEKIIDIISYISAWKALELQSPLENKAEIAKISKTL